MLSFTGSTAVGRTVLQAAATTAKRVHLELGGKAPFVVFDDADLEAAIHGAVAGSLINTGQDCTAATRAIVHRSLYRDFVDGVADLYASVRIGPTDDPATDLGPLISMKHREKVAGMVDRARSTARVLGGGVPGGTLAVGSYYRPTVVADADPASEIVRDEVFGPVLAVLRPRRRGYRPGRRHTVRPGRLGLDPRMSTARFAPPARSGPGAYGSTTTSRSSARCRTAGEAIRLRQGHVELLVRRVHRGQTRDVRPHRGRAEALASNGFHGEAVEARRGHPDRPGGGRKVPEDQDPRPSRVVAQHEKAARRDHPEPVGRMPSAASG